MNNKAKKALVLGGKGGLLGQALVQVLTASGWKVEATGRDHFLPNKTEMMRKSDKFAAYLDDFQPSHIFNTIAYTQVDKAEHNEQEAMLINAVVPSMIGRLIKNRPIHFVHYSTDFVFSGSKKSPYTTDDAPDPKSVYGKTKLAGEIALQQLDLNNCTIIRTAWLFGPGKKNFVKTMLDLCRSRGSVRVVHDQVGSPSYTIDVAAYTLKLLEFEAKGLFHLANGGHASWCELASEAASYAQLECSITPIPSSEYPQDALRPSYSVLDTSAFTRVTGVTPRPWPLALREYLLLEEEIAD